MRRTSDEKYAGASRKLRNPGPAMSTDAVDDGLRDLAGRSLRRLREPERHGGGPVAVVAVAWPLEAGVGRGQTGVGERRRDGLAALGEDGIEVFGTGHRALRGGRGCGWRG
jgi:hypothetical protein